MKPEYTVVTNTPECAYCANGYSCEKDILEHVIAENRQLRDWKTIAQQHLEDSGIASVCFIDEIKNLNK